VAVGDGDADSVGSLDAVGLGVGVGVTVSGTCRADRPVEVTKDSEPESPTPFGADQKPGTDAGSESGSDDDHEDDNAAHRDAR
jgi:hypothetical protein